MNSTAPGPSLPIEQKVMTWVSIIALLVAYALANKWLVSFGSVISMSLLTAQVVSYSLIAAAATVLIHRLGYELPLHGRPRLRWLSLLGMIAAVTVLIVRFFLKQPPSSWTGNTAQHWRDIADGFADYHLRPASCRGMKFDY